MNKAWLFPLICIVTKLPKWTIGGQSYDVCDKIMNIVGKIFCVMAVNKKLGCLPWTQLIILAY